MSNPKKGPEPGSFADAVAGYRNGLLLRQLNDEYTKVAMACNKLGKGGSISLTLSFDPESGSPNGFELNASVSVKLPKPKLPKATFYMDETGRLFRDDPKQADMFPEAEAEAQSTPLPPHDPVTGEVHEGEQRPKLRAVE